MSWLAEFLFEQTAFPHRLTVWMLSRVGFDVGSWVLPSLLRAVLLAGTGIAVFIYLGPERFGETEAPTGRRDDGCGTD